LHLDRDYRRNASQDFTHEGPNSSWYLPLDKWGRVVRYTGWSKSVSSFSPVLGVLLGAAMLLGPFLLALSVIAHPAIRSIGKMNIAKKLR
jgi:hypothetical protein